MVEVGVGRKRQVSETLQRKNLQVLEMGIQSSISATVRVQHWPLQPVSPAACRKTCKFSCRGSSSCDGLLGNGQRDRDGASEAGMVQET